VLPNKVILSNDAIQDLSSHQHGLLVLSVSRESPSSERLMHVKELKKKRGRRVGWGVVG
jgi:hypothetical protein